MPVLFIITVKITYVLARDLGIQPSFIYTWANISELTSCISSTHVHRLVISCTQKLWYIPLTSSELAVIMLSVLHRSKDEADDTAQVQVIYGELCSGIFWYNLPHVNVESNLITLSLIRLLQQCGYLYAFLAYCARKCMLEWSCLSRCLHVSVWDLLQGFWWISLWILCHSRPLPEFLPYYYLVVNRNFVHTWTCEVGRALSRLQKYNNQATL
jgi:hypothetical protein